MGWNIADWPFIGCFGAYLTCWSPKKAGAMRGAFDAANIGAEALGVCVSSSFMCGRKNTSSQSGQVYSIFLWCFFHCLIE